MTNTLLALLLSFQLALPMQHAEPQKALYHPRQHTQAEKTWWGLIDPELALWFARLPGEAEDTILWDWSWQGFFSALFPQPLIKEDSHASSF